MEVIVMILVIVFAFIIFKYDKSSPSLKSIIDADKKRLKNCGKCSNRKCLNNPMHHFLNT